MKMRKNANLLKFGIITSVIIVVVCMVSYLLLSIHITSLTAEAGEYEHYGKYTEAYNTMYKAHNLSILTKIFSPARTETLRKEVFRLSAILNGEYDNKLFNYLSEWRTVQKLPPYVKDESLCSKIDERLAQISSRDTWTQENFDKLFPDKPVTENVYEMFKNPEEASASITMTKEFLTLLQDKHNLSCLKCKGYRCSHLVLMTSSRPNPTINNQPLTNDVKKVGEYTYEGRMNCDQRMGTSQEIFTALNNYRSSNGSKTLYWSDKLAGVAQMRADQIRANGGVSDSHAGFKAFTSNQDNFNSVGFGDLSENIGGGGGCNLSGKSVIEGLFGRDASHNNAQLNNDFEAVGIGINGDIIGIIFGGSPYNN